MMKAYLKLLRVEQWVKNLFVFIPLFFSGKIFETTQLFETIFSFIIFSFTASSIYIINDYSDIESDRVHPEKCRRPLASGAISVGRAKLVLVGLVISTIGLIISLSDVFGYNVLKFGAVISSYFVMNLAYTFRLKHIAIVDISIIAVGFVLRVLAGGYATGIVVSQWAIILTFVLALVLAVGKRRGELVNTQLSGNTRKALDGYNIQFADIVLSISITLAIVSYIMFVISPETQKEFTNKVFYTFIFVIFAFLRYLQQTLVYNRTESPTKMIYKDRYIQVVLALWGFAFLILIYFKD
jgi:ubiA family prenyltransferase